MLTDAQLAAIMPNMPAARRALFLPALNQTMQTYTISNRLRAAAFLGQLAHESGEFKYMEELWGPTAQQLRYEPPSTLATRLGNTKAGDGKRYKGRGPIQVTGRANYKRYGDLLGLDLVGKPELVAKPGIGLSAAGMFWRTNGLNALAELQDYREITRRINGGYTGWEERLRYYEVAKKVLATGFSVPKSAPVPVPPKSRGGPAPVPFAVPAKIPRSPLGRGQEAIDAPAL
ncbi:glycoside hydrolase family 19 protein [uncultured Sphaerotilus sp.]|uniref:glycoside hydrolase family 19 protein n=1 Tax=uncultured Sphaerotilus sp. TaxID=474984 RepID=UPI0030CA2AF0